MLKESLTWLPPAMDLAWPCPETATRMEGASRQLMISESARPSVPALPQPGIKPCGSYLGFQGSNLAFLPGILHLWIPPAHESQAPDFSLCSLFLIAPCPTPPVLIQMPEPRMCLPEGCLSARGSVIELGTQGRLVTGPKQTLPCASVSSLCNQVCLSLTPPPFTTPRKELPT